MINSSRDAENLAKSHYENFPVASILLPKKFRKPIQLIYAFARIADDIADDPKRTKQQKLDEFAAFKAEFEKRSQTSNEFFADLYNVIKTHRLTRQYFLDLLSAFEQDAVQEEYDTMQDVLEYCTRSANPVGRILLELHGFRETRFLDASDAICTGLQLINFWQDLSIDKEMNRFYVPRDVLITFELDRNDFYFGKETSNHTGLISELLKTTRQHYERGASLPLELSGRFKRELKMIYMSGLQTLEKLENNQTKLLYFRPKLSTIDRLKILAQLFV